MCCRETYQDRKSNGICVECGVERAETGRVMCGSCRLSRNDRRKILYEKKLEAGICIQCGQKVERYWREKGSSLCRACRQKSREIQAKRAQRLKAAGICRKCGKRSVYEGEMCAICRERGREYMSIWRWDHRQGMEAVGAY